MIKKLKEKQHQCVDSKDIGLSQSSGLCVESVLDQEMMSSPNKYSQESVCMLNKPRPLESLIGSQTQITSESDSDDDFFTTINNCGEGNKNVEVKYHFDQIIGHEGPLTQAKNQRTYKNCKYNVFVKWSNGDTTREPLNRFVNDSPAGVAKYILDNGLDRLLKEDVWSRASVLTQMDKLSNQSQRNKASSEQ